MMSLLRYFIFILIVISSNKSYSQKNASNKIPGNVFSTFKTTNHIFNETTLESIYFTCLVPKKIVLEEAEKFYSNLGSFEKEKKIFNSTIQTKGEMLSVKLSIEKKDKRIFFYVAQKKELSEENSIKNLQESFICIQLNGIRFAVTVLSFWMKDTPIPLDIAFINTSGQIEGISQLEPFNENPVKSPSSNCVAALETPRGWFSKNKIPIGSIVT